MILIADSGSTKTDWRVINTQNDLIYLSTMGFSPYLQTQEFISNEIKNSLINKLNDITAKSITHVYYYGTGCSNSIQKDIIKNAIRTNLPNAIIEVEHDMLAAARALCENNKGIACILGTGSNSCVYDGLNIVESATSLGYVLGDEGSGSHIGKTFIAAYLNKELPSNIDGLFYSQTKLTKDEILDHVYKKSMPNKYLAAFTKFIGENIHEPYLKSLVKKCFTLFFEKQIFKFKEFQEYNLHSVGSISYHFSDILKKVAIENNVQVGKIIISPIDELVKYHTKNQRKN